MFYYLVLFLVRFLVILVLFISNSIQILISIFSTFFILIYWKLFLLVLVHSIVLTAILYYLYHTAWKNHGLGCVHYEHVLIVH